MFKLEIEETIHLELIHPIHANDIFALVDKNRQSFVQWLDWVDGSKKVEDTLSFIDTSMQAYAKGKSITCVIIYNNVLVGNVSLVSIKTSYGVTQAEVGYWLDVDYQKKGIMLKAVNKLLEIGFEHYDIDKMILRCAMKNHNSCNVAKRLGFVQEGILRQAIKINNTTMDVPLYGLLKNEF